MGGLAALALCVLPTLSGVQPLRLPVVADTSLQAHPSEINFNSGGSSVIRIKGNEHYMLMKFDLAPVAGWRVAKATLFLHQAHPSLLRTVGLSTIAADWQEGTGTSTQAPDGCTFTRAVWPDAFWAGPGSDFLDVALTNGHTLVRYADVHPEPGDWLSVPVDPVLTQALICGDSYGLCLSDEKGQTMANNDVHSREQNASVPYLVVEGEPAPAAPPPSLDPLSAEPWPPAATFDAGALRVRVQSDGAFRYEVTYGFQTIDRRLPLPRYLTPHPNPTSPGQQTAPTLIIIPGLQPATGYEVLVRAVDTCGRGSEIRTVSTGSSAAKAPPAPLPRIADEGREGAPLKTADGLSAWACPAECKVNPVSGNTLEEVGPAQYGSPPAGSYRGLNPVWDASGAHLAAARGEVVALQVVVEAADDRPRTLSLRYVAPGRPDAWPAPVGICRHWYVRDGDRSAAPAWYAEYMAPLADGQATLPAPDNKVPGQRNQAFTLIWEVPRDALPGTKRAVVHISAANAPDQALALPLTVEVLGFEIPAQTSFEVDLNCYGPVCNRSTWDEYLTWERKYYAAAHALRATINSLGYSHSGNVNLGYTPEVAAEGRGLRLTDWSDYDRHWGPYLDGSAFGGVRAGVPISHLYLPLHESWPTRLDGHYTGGNDIRKYPDNIIAHALTAGPVEQAFDRTFQEAFVAATRQFVEHHRERGWLKTRLQCYQNDKYYYKDEKSNFRGTSWWLLDEPMHRDDWLALRFLATLFRQGVQAAGGSPAFVFRGDISRPQFQRDWLDGLVDLMCVSSELFSHPQHCRRFRDQGVTLWHYGEANLIAASNLNAEAWALRAYRAGADGILPWNSIGGDSAFEQPTPTALLVPGGRFGLTGPVVSLRVLALCRGQQDVEYLNLLAQKRGYDRDRIARLVTDFIGLSGRQQGSTVDDAGRVLFDRLSCEDFARLRRSVAAALDG